MIYDQETNTARECKCKEAKLYKRMLDNSGISDAFKQIGLKDFETYTPILEAAKEAATDYIKNFTEIEKERNNSIAFLGNPGSGKTRLSIAIANNLLKKNIAVLYMPYREVITRIKQIILDDEEYNRQLNKFKTARVLLIDDLFKGRINDSDINIMFDIINFRYLSNKPMIVSSEFTQSKLLDFDEAIGSRVIQMCKGRITEIFGNEYNYRLRR